MFVRSAVVGVLMALGQTAMAQGIHAVLVGGTAPIRSGTTILLQFENSTIWIAAGGNRVYQIPTRAVTRATSREVQQVRGGGAVAFGRFAVANGPSITVRRFVSIQYRQSDGSGGSITVGVGQDQYLSLISALESATGMELKPIRPDGFGPPDADGGGFATFRYATDPAGASVWLDGKQIGVTPTSWFNLSAGIHKIAIMKPGFKNWERQVTVVAGETHDVSEQLVRIPEN